MPSIRSRDTAERQLGRILYLLPQAARPAGARVEEIATALGVAPGQVLRDATEVSDRAFYLPAGSGADTQMTVEADRIAVHTRGPFTRPPRLTAREAMALGLGLRSLAADATGAERERLLALAERLEAALVSSTGSAAHGTVALVHGHSGEGEAFGQLRRAARDCRRVRIHYLKPGTTEPAVRTLEPYALVYAERWWYAVGRCCDQDALRRFRIDRVLASEILDEHFRVPAGFDPHAAVPAGRAFAATDAAVTTAEVRYGARVARWIREREPECEIQPDGAVIVRYPVADPGWLVRHVLQYGSEAEVLGPAELRVMVAEQVQQLATLS